MSAVRIPALSKQTATVIFCHGLGDSGSGWAFLADYYHRLGKLQHVGFVFPNAPVMPVTLNYGMQMPAWFDIKTLEKVKDLVDEAGILASVGSLENFVSEEIKKGISSDRIVIGGFSQGTAISLHAGICSNRKLAGIVGLSGYLPLPEITETARTEINKDIPIFLAHGDQDPVIQFKFFQMTLNALKKWNYPVEEHVYPGLTHSTSPEELQDLLAFLEKHLAPK